MTNALDALNRELAVRLVIASATRDEAMWAAALDEAAGATYETLLATLVGLAQAGFELAYGEENAVDELREYLLTELS